VKAQAGYAGKGIAVTAILFLLNKFVALNRFIFIVHYAVLHPCPLVFSFM